MKIELKEDKLTPESELFLKKVAVKFFHYWYTSTGVEPKKGFEKWIKNSGLEVLKELLEKEPAQSFEITPEALKAAGFIQVDETTFTKGNFEVWKINRISTPDLFHLAQITPHHPLRPVYTMPELLKLMEVHAVKPVEVSMDFSLMEQLEPHEKEKLMYGSWKREKPKEQPLNEQGMPFYCYHYEATQQKQCLKQCVTCENYVKNIEKNSKRY